MFKHFVKISVASAGLLVAVSGFAASDNIKIGVVNMQGILQAAPQVKKINTALKKKFSKRKDAILSQAKGLQADMANYNKNKAVLNASKLKDLKGKITSEEVQLRTEQMRYQQDLMAAQNKAMGGFLKRLKFSVTKVADQQGLTLVMPKNSLLYSKASTDITSQVLASLK